MLFLLEKITIYFSSFNIFINISIFLAKLSKKIYFYASPKPIKTMKKLFIFYFLCFFCIEISAQNKSKNTPKTPEISWIFEKQGLEEDKPETTIYLVVNGEKTLIKKATSYFNELEKQVFTQTQYQIPKNALSACSGYWAGLGHHICVVSAGKNSNILEVKEGFLDAESEKGTKVAFKTIKKITFKNK